jgi:predicted  nucleic acid-binding Zn-ribbon protein
MDLKKQKKLILELEQELERLQKGDPRTRDLEERLAERERELKELRRRQGYGAGSEDKIRHLELAVEERSLELRGFRRTTEEMRELELELDDTREALRLKDQELMHKDMELDHVRQLLQDNNDEFERIRNQAEGTPSTSLRIEARQDTGDLHRKLVELETEKEQWEDDRDLLLEEIGIMRGRIEDSERRREAETIERSTSRAMLLDQEEEKAAVEDDLNAMRDKYAAAQIELQQRDDDLDMKEREINDLIDEHGRIIQQVEDDYRAEISDLNQELTEVKGQLDHTRLELDQLEADTKEHNERLEEVMSKVEQDAEDKDIEIAAANGEIEKLGQQIYFLEEENEILKEGQMRLEDDITAEREGHEVLAATLREVSCYLGFYEPEYSRFLETDVLQGATRRNDRSLRAVQGRI